jgi:3-aminobutyryl-CoA ammonia-lyase
MDLTLTTFLGQEDAHYGGGLVAGARILGLFGDAATALMLDREGVEGLLAGYRDVTFHRPVYAGSLVEVGVRVEQIGHSSRQLRFEARVARELVCTASGVVVARRIEPARP